MCVGASVTCGVWSVVDAGVAAAVLARAAAVAVGGAAEVGGVRVTRRAVKLRAAPSVLPNSTRTTGHNLDIQIFFHCSNIFYVQIFSDLLCGGPGAVLLQHEGAGGRHGGGGGGHVVTVPAAVAVGLAAGGEGRAKDGRMLENQMLDTIRHWIVTCARR